jgi:hypothetical protein
MHSEYQSNAMTEIALALAMAFFSIMVLAMLSMGSAMQAQSARALGLEEGIRLAIPATIGIESASTRAVGADAVIIHWRGRFYDGALRPLEPAALVAGGRRVLAIAPDLSIADAMDVREMIATADLEVTTLDARWLQTLEERDP